MPIDKTSQLIAVCTILLVFAVAGLVYYEFRSPTGYYARLNSDISRSEADFEESPYSVLGGENFRLADYIGKPLIINIWASWSPYTQTELALLSKLNATYGDNITIIAMNRGEDGERANAYLSTVGKPDGILYALDHNDRFYESVGGYAMPETLVYDAVGNIVIHKRGTITESELGEVLQGLLTR